MKSNKSASTARVLAFTLVIAMLCMTSAFAEEYTSAKVPHTAGNYTYNEWSSLYIDPDSQCRAGTWICTDNYKNVPAYTMGAYARLYSEATGDLIGYTGWRYNTSEEYFTFAITEGITYSGLVYSQGQVRLYTGTGYETHDAPQTTYAMSGLSAANKTALEALEAGLDKNGMYPKNQLGQTYGSALLAEKVGSEPDLIAAVGEGYVHGYVKAEDLNPDIKNPAEAEAYMKALEENNTVPLYDVNGNVIGTFVLAELKVDGSDNMELAEIQAAVEKTPYKKASYPQNSKGETYGNDFMYQAFGYYPDLIAAIGTNGHRGYVKYKDLSKNDPSTPEEAAEYMKNCSVSRTIPLYDKEGNVIGVFLIGSGNNGPKGKSFNSAEEIQAAMRAADCS
ncbi:MAG: hypothetical protein GX488_10455 [Clostridiales bacterium]|nr:hypothetical protein [Clostridiales bacterium]